MQLGANVIEIGALLRADFSTISKYRYTTVFVLIGLGPRAAVRPGAGTEDPRLAAHPQPPGL